MISNELLKLQTVIVLVNTIKCKNIKIRDVYMLSHIFKVIIDLNINLALF